jgi:hypothetical protein
MLIVSSWSLAIIGNASAEQGCGKDVQPSRGVFDKETRRKPLAFAADAYGISMSLVHTGFDGGWSDWRIWRRSFVRSVGAMAF